MKTEPKVDQFIDDEDREFIEFIESDDFVLGEGLMTSELLNELQEAARNTINEPTVKISLRIPQTKLSRIKALALQYGIPYQTLIKSIIHRAVQRSYY